MHCRRSENGNVTCPRLQRAQGGVPRFSVLLFRVALSRRELTFLTQRCSNRSNWNKAGQDLAGSARLNGSGWVYYTGSRLNIWLKGCSQREGKRSVGRLGFFPPFHYFLLHSPVQCTGKGPRALSDCSGPFCSMAGGEFAEVMLQTAVTSFHC